MENNTIGDGWIRLICAIGVVRSKEYRNAYRRHLMHPKDEAILALMKKWEKKLRNPPTNLDDEDLEKIRKQVREHRRFNCEY